MRVYNVYMPKGNSGFKYELIETVYFNNDCDADYVRKSLINHDGYSRHIIVEEVK